MNEFIFLSFREELKNKGIYKSLYLLLRECQLIQPKISHIIRSLNDYLRHNGLGAEEQNMNGTTINEIQKTQKKLTICYGDIDDIKKEVEKIIQYVDNSNPEPMLLNYTGPNGQIEEKEDYVFVGGTRFFKSLKNTVKDKATKIKESAHKVVRKIDFNNLKESTIKKLLKNIEELKENYKIIITKYRRIKNKFIKKGKSVEQRNVSRSILKLKKNIKSMKSMKSMKNNNIEQNLAANKINKQAKKYLKKVKKNNNFFTVWEKMPSPKILETNGLGASTPSKGNGLSAAEPNNQLLIKKEKNKTKKNKPKKRKRRIKGQTKKKRANIENIENNKNNYKNNHNNTEKGTRKPPKRVLNANNNKGFSIVLGNLVKPNSRSGSSKTSTQRARSASPKASRKNKTKKEVRSA